MRLLLVEKCSFFPANSSAASEYLDYQIKLSSLLCFYAGKIQESQGVILAPALAPHFPKKNSLLLVTFLKKFGLIWNFLFQFFFHWKDTCTKSCLKSKWSGSNSTVKKFKHLLWIQKKKKSMVIAWIASDGTLIAEHFFSCNHRISPNINVRRIDLPAKFLTIKERTCKFPKKGWTPDRLLNVGLLCG